MVHLIYHLLHGQFLVRIQLWMPLSRLRFSQKMNCFGHGLHSWLWNFFHVLNSFQPPLPLHTMFPFVHISFVVTSLTTTQWWNVLAQWLILVKIRSIHLWPCALRHPSNLLYNFIVFSLYYFTNFKAPCISWLNSSIKF